MAWTSSAVRVTDSCVASMGSLCSFHLLLGHLDDEAREGLLDCGTAATGVDSMAIAIDGARGERRDA